MSKRKKAIHIGTSGWNYKHWIGPFYPEGLKQNKWLQFYIDKGLRTVELNNPFYNLPSKKTFENWKSQVPDDFLFAVKANRYITHTKKLLEPEETLRFFIEHVRGLEEKLGVILFQLPPGFKYNRERLEEFLNTLPKNEFRYTFEFRNRTWWNDEVYELLNKHNCSFCIFELAGLRTPDVVTGDFAYIRLHGPDGKYAGKYDDNTLKWWAGNFDKWKKESKDVFCYFDNDQNAYAAENAITLHGIVNDGG